MNIYRPLFFLMVFAVIAIKSTLGLAEEQTVDFDATIDIQKDGWILVSEKIKIHAEGDHFKRGISRPIPVRFYSSDSRNHRRTKIKILSAKRNAHDLDFSTNLFNGKEIIFGFRDKNGPLDAPANHSFEIRYKIGRWIDHLPTGDEFQWNLVGTLHKTPVKKAKLTIRFPEQIEPEKLKTSVFVVAPYTRRVADQNDFRQYFNADGNLCFETTSPLSGHQSLKVSVAFPSGLIDPPSKEIIRSESWRSNLTARCAIGCMIVIAVYYGLSWFFTSRTARIRAVSEKIEVPCDEEGHPYSPAALRFLWRHEFDNRCFAASLMNMASGNLMRMESPEKHVLHFHKESGDPVPPLGLEEFLACEAFFLDEKEQATNFQVAGKEQLLRAKIIIQGAVESLNLLGRFFAEKRGCFDTGTILCFCLFILVPLVEVLFVPESFRLLVFSPFLFVGVLALTNAADRHFREWKSKTNDDKFGVVFILILFYALVITIFVCDAILTTWWAIPLILEIVFFICFFQRRLTYSTPEGIEMQKRIESFRLFLQNNINSDSSTIVRLRPYAFALNLAEEPGFLRDVNWILSED